VAILVLLYRSLRYPGPWSLETENALHYFVFRIAALVFGVAICSAVGSARRHYTLPLSAVKIGTYLLIPAVAAAAGLYLALAAGFNLATGSTWPLIGPALFCAAATSIALAAFWATPGLELLRVLLLVGIGYGVFYWLGLRTPLENSATLAETWRQLTANEALWLLSAIAVSYVAAVVGIRFDRSSQLPWRQLPSLQELWLRLAGGARFKITTKPFRSAWRAQLWREWREKGFVAPFVFFAYLACVLAWYLAGWSSDHGFIVGVVSSGYWLMLLFAVLGLSFGKCGGTIRDPKCGAGFAALPMSDKTLSYAMLRSALASLATTWAFWVTAIVLVSIFFAPLMGLPSARFALISMDDLTPPDSLAESIVSLVLALAAMWTVVGAAATVVMTGRGWLLAVVYVGIVSLAVAYVVGTYWLERYQYAWIIPWIHAGLLAAAVLLTIASFATAIWRRLIGRKDVIMATAVWIVVLVMLEWALHVPSGFQPLHLYRADFVFPFAALLPLFPLAAAPLALSWNRHR
jgi:hypothetical protein